MNKQSSSGVFGTGCHCSVYYTHSGLHGLVEYDTNLKDERVFAGGISVFGGSRCFREPRKFGVACEPSGGNLRSATSAYGGTN